MNMEAGTVTPTRSTSTRTAQLPTWRSILAGVPYLEMTPSRLYQVTDQNQVRATLSYSKDFRKLRFSDVGLGSFSFAAVPDRTNPSVRGSNRDMNTTPVGGYQSQ